MFVLKFNMRFIFIGNEICNGPCNYCKFINLLNALVLKILLVKAVKTSGLGRLWLSVGIRIIPAPTSLRITVWF